MQKHQKTLATSLTALVFFVVGTSGVFLYFHIFERSVKELHELLGLVFVVAALFHVIFNFNAMKRYFSNKIFLASSVVVLIVSLAFIIPNSANADRPNPKLAIINTVLNAPIEDAVSILGNDMELLEEKLKNNNLILNEETTIRQLAKNNNVSPFKIVDLILEK